MNEQWIESFREKLNQHYAWPALYVFKFIVPAERVEDVKNLFPGHTSSAKPSSQGKYVSVTIQMMMPSSEAVIKIYKQAATIPGLIAL